MEPLTSHNTPGPQPKKPMGWRLPALMGLALLLALGLGLMAGYVAKPAPAIVAFDMKGTLDQFMEQSASQALPEARSQQLVARFSQALDDSLAAYQQAHQVVILVSPSVVLGAPDITGLIQRDIATRMRGAP